MACIAVLAAVMSGTASEPEVVYDTDAQAIFDAFTTPADSTRKSLIETAVLALKTAGVWDKLDTLSVFAAADEQAGRVDWILPSRVATAVNSPTFTTDRGFTGNGTTSYINTGWNPGDGGSHNFLLNDCSHGAWNRTEGQNNTGYFYGVRTGANDDDGTLLPRSTADTAVIGLNSDGITTIASVTACTGLLASRRTASNAVAMFRNGSSIGTGATVSSAVANRIYFVLCRNVGSASNLSTRECAMFFAGASLTDQEETDFYTAMNDYMTAVGAA